MAEWTLADATQIRANLTKEQENEISMLYRRVYLQVRKQMLSIPKDGTTSQQIQRQYLDRLHKQLDEAYKSLGVGLEKQIEKEAKKAAQGVVDDSTEFFSKAGLTIEGAHSFVPKEIVNALVTGQVYGGNWSLSGAIWSDIDKKQSDISRIIAEGVAANKSAYDIAKDLETYVDPKAKKEWDWSKVYPGTSKKVDYNAQRLARTMVSHAYQQSLERVCKNNPFVDGFIWQSAHSSRVCPICEARDGQFFKKGELPLDHPNGMCTFIASIQGSMNDVADRLANWVQGNSDPELDNWYQDLMKGNVRAAREKNSKALSTSYKRLSNGTAAFKKFDDYYRNIYDGLYDTDPDAYRAIAESYTGGEYLAMNKLLRTGIFDKDLLVQLANEKELRDEITFAKRAITGIKCPENIIVYRRTSTLGDLAGNTKGSTYTSKGFLSSTLDPKTYEGYDGEDFKSFGKIEIEIRVQKGYDKGSFIHSISMQDKEYEFLFAPDTEFDVVELSKNKVVLLAK